MKHRLRFSVMLGTILLITAACEGPVGPQGPQGSAGPQGIQGPPGLPGVSAEIWWGRVVLDANGEGTVVFPDAQVEGSVVSCYTSNSSTGPWLTIATDVYADISCGAMNSGSDLLIMMNGGIPNWYFLATLAKAG